MEFIGVIFLGKKRGGVALNYMKMTKKIVPWKLIPYVIKHQYRMKTRNFEHFYRKEVQSNKP